jgi:hypothetical protein
MDFTLLLVLLFSLWLGLIAMLLLDRIFEKGE